MENSSWQPAEGEPLSMEAPPADWRSQLQPDVRQKVMNKIMDTLVKHLHVAVPEGMNELKKIAVRFEEKIYTAAVSKVRIALSVFPSIHYSSYDPSTEMGIDLFDCISNINESNLFKIEIVKSLQAIWYNKKREALHRWRNSKARPCGRVRDKVLRQSSKMMQIAQWLLEKGPPVLRCLVRVKKDPPCSRRTNVFCEAQS
ncbi:hypothetical protein HPP92_010613 [Vanilla planifolia]|uniref:Mediator complex subunit 15 KIX domain-containing protein n=1 Tax=Vanilla planifolia TaxID=51239 RepID=A0A835V090_VANPL|nr:hypothetical protein HPP92_010613 [Vanilla planifolia]